MPISIKMPALSPTMTDGTLAKWLVKEGDEVRSGDVIAEIETDKATMEVEAIDEGIVAVIACLSRVAKCSCECSHCDAGRRGRGSKGGSCCRCAS